MYHALTNVQSGDSLHLPQYIDNRDGLLRVGLRSITFTVGWNNLYHATHFEGEMIYPGLYGFDALKAFIERASSKVKVDLDKNTGSGRLTVNAGAGSITLPGPLAGLLGLTHLYDVVPGQRRGIPIPFPLDAQGVVTLGTGGFNLHPDLALPRVLNVYLEQINTSDNYVDGQPSTLLASVGIVRTVVFGDIEHAEFPNSPFKRLQDGTIHELKVVVCDDKGNPIDNHGQAISVELEIKKE